MKKSLTKKFIISILTVAFAVVSLGTSTFAWFTMNDSVTATGMQVKASAGTGLVISGWNDAYKSGTSGDREGWTTAGGTVNLGAINTAVRATTIVPTSTIDAAHWFTATAAASDSASVDSTVAAPYTFYDDTAATFNKYSSTAYLYNKVVIQTNDSAGISGKHLEIGSITASNGASAGQDGLSADLNKAIRVAFVVNGTDVYIYAPNEASYPEINGVKYTANQGGTGYSAEAVTMASVVSAQGSKLKTYGSETASFSISESSIAASTEVEIYVYYDGEDANCFTNNTLDGVDTLTLSVAFNAVENQSN